MMSLYCNPLAQGRAHIIITHPISDIYAQSLMSATGYTLSEFTPGYPWPVWSTPYDLLSGQLSCQDSTFTVGPVILPGLQAWWCNIRVRCPNWEVGTTWASLAGTPHSLCMSGTWSGHPNTTICVRNLWKAVVLHQGWMSQWEMGCYSDVTGWSGGSDNRGLHRKNYIRLLVSPENNHLASLLFVCSCLL